MTLNLYIICLFACVCLSVCIRWQQKCHKLKLNARVDSILFYFLSSSSFYSVLLVYSFGWLATGFEKWRLELYVCVWRLFTRISSLMATTMASESLFSYTNCLKLSELFRRDRKRLHRFVFCVHRTEFPECVNEFIAYAKIVAAYGQNECSARTIHTTSFVPNK